MRAPISSAEAGGKSRGVSEMASGKAAGVGAGAGQACPARAPEARDPHCAGPRLAPSADSRRAARPRLPGNRLVVLSRLRAAVLPGGPRPREPRPRER